MLTRSQSCIAAQLSVVPRCPAVTHARANASNAQEKNLATSRSTTLSASSHAAEAIQHVLILAQSIAMIKSHVYRARFPCDVQCSHSQCSRKFTNPSTLCREEMFLDRPPRLLLNAYCCSAESMCHPEQPFWYNPPLWVYAGDPRYSFRLMALFELTQGLTESDEGYQRNSHVQR